LAPSLFSVLWLGLCGKRHVVLNAGFVPQAEVLVLCLSKDNIVWNEIGRTLVRLEGLDLKYPKEKTPHEPAHRWWVPCGSLGTSLALGARARLPAHPLAGYFHHWLRCSAGS